MAQLMNLPRELRDMVWKNVINDISDTWVNLTFRNNPLLNVLLICQQTYLEVEPLSYNAFTFVTDRPHYFFTWLESKGQQRCSRIRSVVLDSNYLSMGVSITDREISSKKWAQSINRLPSLQHLILQDQLQRSSSGNIAEWYGDGIGNDPSSVNPPESHIYHAMLKLSSLKSFTQLSCRPLPAIVLFNKVHLERLNIMSPGLAPSKIALNKEDKLTGLRLLKMGTWLWPGEGDDNSCSAIGQSDWFTRNEHVWNFKTPVQGSIVPIEKYYGWAWHGANTCHVDDILAIAPGLRCLICDVDQFIFTGDSIPASLEHLVLAFRRVADYEPLLERFQRLVSRCKSMKTLSINVFSMWPGDSVRASMTTEVSANFRKFLHRLRIECGVHTRFIVNMPKEWRDMRETPVDPEGHIIQSGFFA